MGSEKRKSDYSERKDNKNISGRINSGRKKNVSTVRERKPRNYDKDRKAKNIRENRDTKNTDKFQNLIVSVVIPIYNEEESLIELSESIENVLNSYTKNRYEVIFIDDGSRDNSFSVIRKINKRNRKFRAIRFRRNYGKAAALSVGFHEAKGNYVITMDGDLQDDPAEIPLMIQKLNDGFDLVSGWKKNRKDPISKTLPSKLFNYVTSKTSGVKLHDHNCGLKAYKKDVVKNVEVYGEMHRYIPALANWAGFRVTEIPVHHHARKYGKSKYGITRLVKGYLDLLTVLFTTRYMKRPLHFFGTFGSLFAITGFIIDLYLTIEWAMNKTSLSNRPLTLFGIALIIVGVQFISMGLIGELITKNNVKNESYGIKERI